MMLCFVVFSVDLFVDLHEMEVHVEAMCSGIDFSGVRASPLFVYVGLYFEFNVSEGVPFKFRQYSTCLWRSFSFILMHTPSWRYQVVLDLSTLACDTRV